MKNYKLHPYIAASMIAVGVLVSFNAQSQERKLPDGTIIYSDGSRRLPNGTIIYKDGTRRDNDDRSSTRRNRDVITLPDGSVRYPDGTRRYPNEGDRRKNHKQRKDGKWMPPGQAKKMYGGKAKDYAPGQHKEHKGKHKNKHNKD